MNEFKEIKDLLEEAWLKAYHLKKSSEGKEADKLNDLTSEINLAICSLNDLKKMYMEK